MLHTNICRHSQLSGTKGYQVVHDFSLEVFSENGEAQASSIFGLFVLQNIAMVYQLNTKRQLGQWWTGGNPEVQEQRAHGPSQEEMWPEAG